jgi:acyl dehydratase
MGAWRKRTLDQVVVGETLPALEVEVTPTTVVLGALASRDWRPMHHDKDFAQQRNGVRHIFVNTPHNAAYFERYITDWTGPWGRLGRIRFRMKDSVFPGDRMVFHGSVKNVSTDECGCGWVDLELRLAVGEKTTTECTARVALPTGSEDNPWMRRGDDWRP